MNLFIKKKFWHFTASSNVSDRCEDKKIECYHINMTINFNFQPSNQLHRSDFRSVHMLCVRDHELAWASKNQQITAALTCRQILAGEQIRGYTSYTPTKFTGFASISGTASGKSGVDMSTPGSM